MIADKKVFYRAYATAPLESLDDPFTVEEVERYAKIDGYFEGREEAIAHFLSARSIATERIRNIRQEFTALQNRLEFYISYDITGDTHGVHCYQYIGVSVDGYEFMWKL